MSISSPSRASACPGRETYFQDQVTSTGKYAFWMHTAILMPLITIISIFVLALMLWAMFRFRRAANPVPSKTSHNTAIEIAWTLIPVFILVGIAIPSIDLLAKQFKARTQGRCRGQGDRLPMVLGL